MKRAREEFNQDGNQGEKDASKNGVGGGSESGDDRKDLRMLFTTITTMAEQGEETCGVTDTNSNQMQGNQKTQSQAVEMKWSPQLELWRLQDGLEQLCVGVDDEMDWDGKED